MVKRFGLLLLAVTLALGLASCGGAGEQESAEEYPSEDIDMIIPYTAGGPTDLAGRSVASSLEEQFGQTVVVENLPGASGAVGTNEMLSEDPDGYTIMVFTGGTAVITPLSEEVGYASEDIAPIGLMTEISSVLAVNNTSEYESAEELLEAADAEAGEVNVGTPGASTPQAIELQRLAEEYSIEVSSVPFDGNTEMISALLGENVDAILANASEDIVAQIEAGEFRPLAVTTEERVDFLPDVPTLAESGYEELTLGNSIFALGAPADTPPEIVGELEGALEEALEDPEVREQIGEDYVPEEFVGAEELQERVEEIQASYEPILGG